MINKLKYEYNLSFRKILQVDLNHEYFNDGLMKFFDFLPSANTLQIFRNYKMIFRKTNEGFVILSENDDKFLNKSFIGKIDLSFKLIFNDMFFLNYTQIPYKNNVKLNFSNSYKNYLHKNTYVDKNCIYPNQENLSGQIDLTINQKDEFYGSKKRLKQKFSHYKISFGTRKIFIRYNFNINEKNLKGYYITDEDNSFKLKKFKKRKTINGNEIFYLLYNKEIELKELSNRRFFLKKDDEFFKSFSIPLANPDKQNVLYDNINDVFYGDIYVSI